MAAALAVIVGVGEGISSAVAHKFASEGCAVALVGRTASKLQKVQAEIKQNKPTATVLAYDGVDAGKPDSVVSVFQKIKKDYGHEPEILIYNASVPFSMKPLIDISTEEMISALNVTYIGAFVAAQQVLPAMIQKKKGTILFTGASASLRGGGKFVALSAPKFAVRSLSQSIAREYGPMGVHCAHIIIDGIVDKPELPQQMRNRALLKPEAIATSFWQLHAQDPSAWTQELDLRPFSEGF